jgi:hypothetical protein
MVEEEKMTDLPQRLRDLAEVLDGIEWDIPLLSKEACLEAAGIIEKLPKTADGVAVVPGMRLYVTTTQSFIVTTIHFKECKCATTRYGVTLKLYSTRESAEAVRTK